jgi:surfactin synthase thioesterase subunit
VFTNHVRNGSHFLMADDEEYILQTINNEFARLVVSSRDGQSVPV